ncbi:hypothetical protein [Pseudomonas fluorescens]|jgi:hypothetical protein|uniref:hypothetical protein n=1 Tax=Pseudomonas fluorescens TaxID=294 RepID=UPI001878B27B|nr:hypothetical protein [Pseudomonas fluorescens]
MYPVGVNKNVVIVLGMHRSGTSAIAAGLEQLGLTMGSSLYQGDEWNPKGYFEERQVVEFNNRLLTSLDRRWDSPLPPELVGGDRWQEYIDEAVELVQGLFGEAPAWGFKDPRMCQLAPFWGEVFVQLEVKPQLMMVVRDPAEVAHSLARRDGISVDRAAWLWMTHLLGALEYLDISEDMRFFAFDDLLFQPAAFLSGVAHWLKLTPDQDTVDRFARDFIAPTLSHGSGARQISLPSLVVRAYDCVRSAIEHGVSPSDFRKSVQWVSITTEYQRDIIPALLSIQEFYKNDRQLSVMESRISALTKGLAVAEKLAVERLDEMQKLNAQLIRTSDALFRAEQIVLERQSLINHASEQREKSAWSDAAVTRLRQSEALAVERLEQIQKLDAQLNQSSAALARAEQIVLDQQGMLARQDEVYSLFREAELIAVERLNHMQKLDSQLIELSAALSHAESIVAEQRLELMRRDEVQARFQETQMLAFERLAEMQKLNAQLIQTSDALAHAERIVLEQQEALARANSLAPCVEANTAHATESLQEASLDTQIK